MAKSQTLVVIGNGMVSWKLCQRLVEHGAHNEIRIVVFGEEMRPAYARTRLTNLFSGASEASLSLAPRAWYEKNGIELYLGDPVIAVDRPQGLVQSASGRQIEYNRLVFATGSRPFVPQPAWLDLPGVFIYRTIDHFLDIERYRKNAKVAAVVGGGLLGLEAAKALADLGLKVHVIESGPGLMHRQMDPPGATILKTKIEALGVSVHVHKELARILSTEAAPISSKTDAGRLELQFADGKDELRVDMVLITAGVRPRSELAQKCGLVCSANGGIVVDERLQTSDDEIFAIGECAAHQGITYGLVLPGYQMVDVLVTNLLGGKATFQDPDQSTKLNVAGMTVAAVGEYDGEGKPLTSTLRYTDGGVYRKVVARQGLLIGAVTVGDWYNLERIRESLRAPVPMSFWDIRRFRSTGNLWRPSKSRED